jgi:hypothetical protein
MNWAALLTSLVLGAVEVPQIWEMDVDKPSLQINYTADAVRGMKSGKTCRLAREVYTNYGGTPRKNQCSLALEAASGVAYFAYCDAKVSYLLQLDLNACRAAELTEFRNKRLTGTAVLDRSRKRVFFSHLQGIHAYAIGATQSVAGFPDAAVFSKHEFFADRKKLYLLNTVRHEPVLHRIDLDNLKETRVKLGKVMVVDYAGGRLLLRGLSNKRAFGLYDVRTKKVVQRWQSPANSRAHFVGDGWVAFWTRPQKGKPGDWILANAATGESVYHGKWTGTKPPSVRWKGRALYAGKKKLLVADKAPPIRTPLQKIAQKRAG